jgi:hypothetical protein
VVDGARSRDAAEKVVVRKQLRRGQVMKFFAARSNTDLNLADPLPQSWLRPHAAALPSSVTF